MERLLAKFAERLPTIADQLDEAVPHGRLAGSRGAGAFAQRLGGEPVGRALAAPGVGVGDCRRRKGRGAMASAGVTQVRGEVDRCLKLACGHAAECELATQRN